MYNIFLNPSITAILFGIAVVVLFTLTKNVQHKLLLGFVLCLLLLSIIGVIYYNSRAVWLSVVLVLGIITISQQKLKLTTTVKLSIAGCLSTFLLVVLLYKYNSTLGRLFIYKINALVIHKYWLTGINQPYSVEFNHTQASYFINNSNATLQQKLLAGNNYFVLNEWLNILIHYGIVVFIFTLFATIYLVKICFKQLKSFPKKAWAVGIVLFLLMVSLASYPFSFMPYLFIFGICALCVLKDAFNLPQKINNTIFCTLLIGLSAFCLN
ncbi:MAG: hypothetical protein MUE72_01730, partial [Chitinophagaceae bacterium]|nr:hypothetical protein [Chitinophagaceae bacterium]